MPFVKMPGLQGKVYVPEIKDRSCKKHPCKDCFSCEFCSDDRCGVCLNNIDSDDLKECSHKCCHILTKGERSFLP